MIPLSVAALLLQTAGAAPPTTKSCLWLDSNEALTPCDDVANCVSSRNDMGDAQRYVRPLLLGEDPALARTRVLRMMQDQERTQLVAASDSCFHYTTQSRVFGFVDDIVFTFEHTGGVVQIRSESRSGYWDLGVNRKRVEHYREQLAPKY